MLPADEAATTQEVEEVDALEVVGAAILERVL